MNNWESINGRMYQRTTGFRAPIAAVRWRGVARPRACRCGKSSGRAPMFGRELTDAQVSSYAEDGGAAARTAPACSLPARRFERATAT